MSSNRSAFDATAGNNGRYITGQCVFEVRDATEFIYYRESDHYTASWQQPNSAACRAYTVPTAQRTNYTTLVLLFTGWFSVVTTVFIVNEIEQ